MQSHLLGASNASDEAMLRVDDITWLLLDAMGKAFLARDERWMRCYAWFCDLVNDLLGDLPIQLDG